MVALKEFAGRDALFVSLQSDGLRNEATFPAVSRMAGR
jgi:hypothetical protein